MRVFPVLIILLIVLAACGGTPPAEATQAPPAGETAVSADPTTGPAPTLAPDQLTIEALSVEQGVTRVPIETLQAETPIVTLPGVGTLARSITEDPNAGLNFNRLRFERSGGPLDNAGTPPPPILFEISGDGTLQTGDRTSSITPAALDALNTLIRQMDFFGAQGMFMSEAITSGDGTFYYSITVQREDGTERTINAQDGYMPPELLNLVGYLLDINNRIDTPLPTNAPFIPEDTPENETPEAEATAG